MRLVVYGTRVIRPHILGAARAYSVGSCLWGFGTIRGALLALPGVRIVAIDPERTPWQVLAEIVAFLALGLLAHEAVAYARPLRRHLAPEALGTVVVDRTALRVLGGTMALAALMLWLAAMRAMGSAWRIDIDRRAAGGLLTDGIFRWTRNPIYLAFDLLALGAFLVQGRLLFLLLALLLAPLLHGLILREERFLEQRYGAAYGPYRARVGQYLTL